MKNLLERLKPEYLELLNTEAEKYPNAINSIKKDLIENVTFGFLTVNSAHSLCVFCKFNLSILELSSLFEKYE